MRSPQLTQQTKKFIAHGTKIYEWEMNAERREKRVLGRKCAANVNAFTGRRAQQKKNGWTIKFNIQAQTHTIIAIGSERRLAKHSTKHISIQRIMFFYIDFGVVLRYLVHFCSQKCLPIVACVCILCREFLNTFWVENVVGYSR